MLRVSMVQGSRIVSLPDYSFISQHIELLEKLSLFCPNHPVRVQENDGRVHIVPISSLLTASKEVLKLNATVVP